MVVAVVVVVVDVALAVVVLLLVVPNQMWYFMKIHFISWGDAWCNS